jgi:tetratricopeptide (TPR) repeat protein
MEAPASEVFVGRVGELGRLERALEASRAGSGTAVLVAGEAGIGKTRLASELAARARAAGFEVLLGRSIDLVGTELPYQPLVEALGPLGALPQVDGQAAGSQLRLFQETLALLGERAAAAPVLLALEDLHWADTSTLDLVVFLAHNLPDRRVLLLGTYRADEPASAARVRRLADGVRRSGAALVLELGPLQREELTALLAAHAGAPPPAALTEEIVARSEGNPFFAEELFAAAGDHDGALPRGLRELLLQRTAQLDAATQGLLRLTAAAGRDVGYPLLRAVARLPERDLRESLRRAVEHGVLVAEQATGSFRFRHALLAEAVYATVLPGEREELHGRLAQELARSAAAAPAELAPHWAAAGRSAEALAASVEAARQAQAVFGLAEALAHLERALALWDAVRDAAELVRLDLAGLCAWAAELAWDTGAAPRAVELAQRAIELVGDGDRPRAALLHEGLGRYLHTSGRGDAALAAFQRAVELAPARPSSPERAQALAALANGLLLAWRYDESLAVCEQALALARAVGPRQAELLALTVLGTDLAYLGRGGEGLAKLWQALRLAEAGADPVALERAYVHLTDLLLMLGRPGESARLVGSALDVLRPYGRDHSTLVANRVEALVAGGEWDQADRVSAAALRAITANYPHQPLGARAWLELGRGDFDQARAHVEAARATLRPPGRRRRPQPAWSRTQAARHRPPRRRGGHDHHPERRRLARPGRGRAPARPRRRPARVLGRRRGHLGAAPAPAAGGLLPLAPGRGAGRRRRHPRRGERAAQAGARRRDPDRGEAPAPRAGAARPARAAGARAAGRRVTRPETGPGGGPRPDASRGGGPDLAGPWLHQPRDRGGAGDQRQDGRRARLAHPAQARRPEPARGGRHRAPPLPAARRAACRPLARSATHAMPPLAREITRR